MQLPQKFVRMGGKEPFAAGMKPLPDKAKSRHSRYSNGQIAGNGISVEEGSSQPKHKLVVESAQLPKAKPSRDSNNRGPD